LGSRDSAKKRGPGAVGRIRHRVWEGK